MNNELSSENNDVVLLALMKARRDMQHVVKDATNPFHKSSYASLNSYINAIDDALFNHNLIIYQSMVENEGKPVLVTTLSHPESKQWIRSYAPLLNPSANSQGLGSAITYMRRYSIGSLLGLIAEDDDGESADGRGKLQPKKEPVKPIIPLIGDKEIEFRKTDDSKIPNFNYVISDIKPEEATEENIKTLATLTDKYPREIKTNFFNLWDKNKAQYGYITAKFCETQTNAALKYLSGQS